MTELRTKGDPIAVQYDTVTSALEFLGIFDHDNIVGVQIARCSITVERLRRDEDNRAIRAGDKAATTTTVIAIRRDVAGSAVMA